MKEYFSHKKCPEGKDIKTCNITFKCRYSIIGYIFFYSGISARPVKVEFNCIDCGKNIHTTEDDAVLKEFEGR